MERRSHERVPAHLDTRLFYGNMIYAGVVYNLSESGMFIHTRVSFPVDSVLLSLIRSGESIVKLPIRVRRHADKDYRMKHYNEAGLGVELMKKSVDYIEMVNTVKASL